MSTTTDTEFLGEDDPTGSTTTATGPSAPPVEPPTQPDAPDCPPRTHKHKDGTTHPGIECSGGCIK